MTASMIHGLAPIQAVNDLAALPDALDRWRDRTGTYPDAVPLWVRLHDWGVEATATAWLALRDRGIQALLYVEDEARVSDGRINDFAQFVGGGPRGPKGVIVRYLQEPNGEPTPGPGWRWRDRSLTAYVSEFRRFADAMRRYAPQARLAYCVSTRGRQHLDRIDATFPGADYVDVMGLDVFARSLSSRFIRDKTRLTRRRLRALHPTAPLWIFEYGVQRGIGSGRFRRQWLRSVERVPGLEGAVYLDLAPPGETYRAADGTERPVDWRMGRRMQRQYGRMVTR